MEKDDAKKCVLHYTLAMKQFIKLIRFLALAVALLFFASCAGGAKFASAGLGSAQDPVPFMADARTGVLSSGMRYYLFENAMPEGRAFLTLAVNAGSILETEGERGLAHFVEHMAFNGTERFPKSELINYLRSLGMRFGPDINARTSFDWTIYDIEVPVETGADGRNRIPERALAIIDDWTWSVAFDPGEVENERLVILEEYRVFQGARERINRQVFPVLFRDSQYALRLPIGLLSVLQNAEADDLAGFYNEWYRPENMSVAIVGDFDLDILEADLEKHFPVRRSGETPFIRPQFDLRNPKKGSLETLVLTDSELTQSRVDLYWQRSPEMRRPDLSYYRNGLIDSLINTMLSLRFHEDAAKSETPYVWAAANAYNFGFSSRFFQMASQAKTNSVVASLRELLLVRESLTRRGFTQNELNEAKSFILSSLEQLNAEDGRRESSGFVQIFTMHFLDGIPAPDVSWELNAAEKFLPGISLREINRAVRNYFAEDDLTVIITAPESETNLPGDSEIRAMISEARRTRVSLPARNSIQGELLEFVPEPGTIVSESVDSETGAVRLRMGNGGEAILLQTRNTNNQIAFYALAEGGTFAASETAAVSANLAAEILNVSGMGSFSRTELTRLLLDKQASLSFWVQNFLRGFQGSAAVQDSRTLFEMLYINFTQPRFDPDAVDVMLSQLRSRMANQENDPSFVFRREVTRTTHGNLRYHPIALGDLDALNLDDALSFIANSLNPADYTFVIVGNFDLPAMRSLTETYLASIPVPNVSTHPGFDINFFHVSGGDPLRPSSTEKKIFKGKEDRSIVDIRWFRPQDFSEEKLAVASVLSEYLDIQLTDVIREKLGGVYSIGSWVSLSSLPVGELLGVVNFVSDPGRAEELIAAVEAELRKIAAGEIDPGVFGKAVEALVRGHEEIIQRDSVIAQSFANSAVIFNSPLSRQNRRPSLYRAARPGDVQNMMRELLGGSRVQMVLFPE